MDILGKENIKSKKILTQNIQKIQDTIKQPNLGLEKGEETQLKVQTPKIFLTKSYLPNLKKKVLSKCKKHTEDQIDWTRKQTPLTS